MKKELEVNDKILVFNWDKYGESTPNIENGFRLGTIKKKIVRKEDGGHLIHFLFDDMFNDKLDNFVFHHVQQQFSNSKKFFESFSKRFVEKINEN